MQRSDRLVGRLKLRELYIVQAVAEHGSMAKAAEHLAISHPVISKVIAELEHTLGVRLFDRNARGVEPTIYGRELLKCGVAVFDEIRQGLDRFDSLVKGGSGELRIGCNEAMAAGLLPVIAEEFSGRCPGARLHIVHAEMSSAQFDELRERNVDMLLGTLPRPSVADDLIAERLFDENIVVVGGIDSRWAHRRHIDFEDLKGEAWVLSPSDSVPGRMRAEILAANAMPMPKGAIFSLSIHLTIALAASGRLIALMPASVVRFNPGRHALKVLRVQLPPYRVPVGFVTVKNRTINPLARHFVACAQKAAAPLLKDG
jgi:DNA-binding transcriptional LysR family regulator